MMLLEYFMEFSNLLYPNIITALYAIQCFLNDLTLEIDLVLDICVACILYTIIFFKILLINFLMNEIVKYVYHIGLVGKDVPYICFKIVQKLINM